MLYFFFNDTATTEIYTLSLHVALFFFNDTATTEIYTLSLHDALPICFVFYGVGSGGATASCAARVPDIDSPHGDLGYPRYCAVCGTGGDGSGMASQNTKQIGRAHV